MATTEKPGNVLWSDNLVNSAFGELYSYDNLTSLNVVPNGHVTRANRATGHRVRQPSCEASSAWATGLTSPPTASQRRTRPGKAGTNNRGRSATRRHDYNATETTDEDGPSQLFDAGTG